MTPAPQRIILVPDGTASRPPVEPQVRRYRLARMRIAETRQPAEPRFQHLLRSYD